ncbi:unnamed protein product [Ilex paraguariensis]|uniref:DYW domain-containing protein n=1 Tax=Ilex paraguariensis TaxID=185542 RepID=A0ABC8R7R3_9AQUA
MYHSEKLAIVFGMINLLLEKTIRIRQNLRICGDCHVFAKLLAKMECRSIVIRDPIRYTIIFVMEFVPVGIIAQYQLAFMMNQPVITILNSRYGYYGAQNVVIEQSLLQTVRMTKHHHLTTFLSKHHLLGSTKDA